MRVNYESYRIFYHVAKYKSFTQAARVLLNSQPNISRAIRNLEQELGCSLFYRGSHHVRLTPEGETLYRYVAAACEQLQAGEAAICGENALQGGAVRIAATDIAMQILLLPVLKEFRCRYPGVRIQLISGTTPQAIEAMRAGQADVAIVTSPVRPGPGLEQTLLTTFSEAAVCAVGFAPPMGSTPVSLEALTHCPLISLGPDTGTRHFYESLFASHGLPFAPQLEAATENQVLPMVQAGLGIGFLPQKMLPAGERGQTYQTIHLDTNIPQRQICLISHAGIRSGPAVAALNALLREA